MSTCLYGWLITEDCHAACLCCFPSLNSVAGQCVRSWLLEDAGAIHFCCLLRASRFGELAVPWQRFDPAVLIPAAIRAFSGSGPIGFCEDRGGYVDFCVPNQLTPHCVRCHGLPMYFTGRAFLCSGRAVAAGIRGREGFAAMDVRAGSDVCGGERHVTAGAGTGQDLHAYGVYQLNGDSGDNAVGRLALDASWLDATGADNGVACLGGLLTAARFVTPAGGAFGAGCVVDVGGAAAPRVVVEPQGPTAPAGETDANETSDNG